MSFWDRRMQEIKSQPPRSPGMPYHSPAPARHDYPHADTGYGQDPLPGYVQQQLAIRRGGRKEEDLARRIQHEGYLRKPPSWVQRQPHDLCPNCHGPDMAAVSAGGYSAPGAPGAILRCFDCGWSSARGVPALYGIPASGPVTGAAVQSRDGHVSLRNTGLITT